MMDHIGSFSVGIALVLVSALHIVSAPLYLNAIPAMLVVYGLARIIITRSAPSMAPAEDLNLAPLTDS